MLRDNEVIEALLAEMHEGLCITDKAGVIIGWNRALFSCTGIDEEMAVGKPFAEFAHAASWRTVAAMPDMELHFADSIRTVTNGDADTLPNRAADEVEVPWNALQQFLEALPCLALVLNHSGTILFANAVARASCDVSAEAEFAQTIRSVVQEGVPVTGRRIRLRDSDGNPAQVEMAILPAHFAGSGSNFEPLLLCAGVESDDVFSTRQALTRERNQLAATLDGIGDGVAAVDAAGRILLMNAVLEELSGVTVEDATGRLLEEVMPVFNEHNSSPAEGVVTFIRSGSRRVERHNLVHIRRGGEAVLLEQTLQAVVNRDATVSGAVVVYHDVTEKRRTEEELRKAQKLESIATMARGIAHDFNNILTAILGSITLLRMANTFDHDFYESLSDADRAVAEAKTLTRQLLVFAEGRASVRDDTLLGELVSSAADFALRGTNVRARYELATDLHTVRADKTQIVQVIQNIVMNAREAMPEGGNVALGAANVRRAFPDRPGVERDFVAITVKDQGSGIPRDYLARVFDPYFTTKAKSAGLGLAIAYSIVRNHDGYIELESVLGSGTTITVFLPASRNIEPPAIESMQETPLKFNRRVLVLEDERIVRDVLLKMFTRLGCKCSFAENGVDAIYAYEKARESGFPFDMVVLDLTVPGGMGGQETMLRLREVDPDVVAVVSSGYVNDPVIADCERFGFKATIIKPYSMQDLVRLLKRLFPPDSSDPQR